MTTRSDPPAGAISYEQWLLNRIAHPGAICGPPVIDDRPWWQHLPGLNPYHELEQRARADKRHRAATADLDPGPGMREAEAR
jgi:hypothetical protein